MTLRLTIGADDSIMYPGRDVSTADVADFIEAKYHIFSMFLSDNAQVIADKIATGMMRAIEEQARSGRRSSRADIGLRTEAAEIRTMLVDSIAARKYDGRAPGVPTQASLEGRRSSLKSGYTKGRVVRASFVDTFNLVRNLEVEITDPSGYWGSGRQPRRR